MNLLKKKQKMKDNKIIEELIEACRYGYNYHKKFPDMEFDEKAINIFKRMLESKNIDFIKNTIEKEIIISEDSKTVTIKSHLGNEIIKITSPDRLKLEYGK